MICFNSIIFDYISVPTLSQVDFPICRALDQIIFQLKAIISFVESVFFLMQAFCGATLAGRFDSCVASRILSQFFNEVFNFRREFGVRSY